MKQLLCVNFIMAIFIFSSSFKKSDANQTPIEKTNIEVIFNHKLSFEDIVKIKTNLSEKGISLTYRRLIFDESDKLLSVDFYVNCNDGYAGGDQLDNLTDKSHSGFYRNYSKDAKKAFLCGSF